MSVLVVAEHDNVSLKPINASVLAAARQISESVTVLVLGDDCRSVADMAATFEGVERVLLLSCAELKYQLAEDVAPVVVGVMADFEHLLVAATTTGKNLLPRVAALMDVQPLSDVVSVESPDTFKRPIYAGNCLATVKITDDKKCVSVRGSCFDPVATGGSSPVIALEQAVSKGGSTFVDEVLSKSERPELTAAKVVVSGGRGLGSADNFELLERLADKLNGAVGASRAAVDAGYVANDLQVGQTGKIVAPELYIAVGISGAIQHLAGMKGSKVIVAINKDEDAPIFQVADYGLVADLFDVLPELEAAL